MINGVDCEMLIDIGASINALDEQTSMYLQDHSVVPCTLKEPDINLYAYGSKNPIRLLGKFNVCVSAEPETVDTVFYIAEGARGRLLSFETASELGIIHIIYILQQS